MSCLSNNSGSNASPQIINSNCTFNSTQVTYAGMTLAISTEALTGMEVLLREIFFVRNNYRSKKKLK